MRIKNNYIPIDMIKINQDYSDMVFPLSDESYESLKENIKEKGQMIPVSINDVYTLLDGHHRIKILKELGIKEVNVKMHMFKDDLEEELFVIDANLQRRHLTAAQLGTLRAKRVKVVSKYTVAKKEANLKVGTKVPESAKFALSEDRLDASEIVAESTGVSERTVKTDVAREKIIEEHKDEPEIKEVRKQINRGEIKSSSGALKAAKEAEKKVVERKEQEVVKKSIDGADILTFIEGKGIENCTLDELKPMFDQVNDRILRALTHEIASIVAGKLVNGEIDSKVQELHGAIDGQKARIQEVNKVLGVCDFLYRDRPDIIEKLNDAKIEYETMKEVKEDQLKEEEANPSDEIDKIMKYLGDE